MKVYKKITAAFCAAVLLVSTFAGCSNAPKQDAPASSASASSAASITFTDDESQSFTFKKPCTRIISMYSAHTENLFELGAGASVIGVGTSTTFPPEAASLPVYDYKADPEKVIAAQPDAVIIRPAIAKSAPDFVAALKQAGIPVVSLYPNRFDAFDAYIQRLAQLSGTQETAKEKLAAFHQDLQDISKKTNNLPVKKSVFFESMEKDLRTVTEDSMPALAIETAGGTNAAKGAKAAAATSSIALFGTEKLLSIADQIDVYIAQKGAMNSGADVKAISERAGFQAIKAVKNNQVYILDEKLISSPTFRYVEGVRQMARFLYPDVMDDLAAEKTGKPATREDFARILMKGTHLPLYLPSSPKYYKTEHEGHTFGLFEDVSWDSPNFYAIEAVVQKKLLSYRTQGEKEYFDPKQTVTRDEAAQAIASIKTFTEKSSKTEIKDLSSSKNQQAVQMLVDNEIFHLENGNFEPGKTMTTDELVALVTAVQTQK